MQQDVESEGVKSEEFVLQEGAEAEAELPDGDVAPHIPLLQLVQQLLRNSSTQTSQSLQEAFRTANRDDALPDAPAVNSPSLDLLLQFQRQLVAKIYALETNLETAIASKPGKPPLCSGNISFGL